MNTTEQMQLNLENHRRIYHQRTIDAGRYFIEHPLLDYERKLAQIALDECKSKQEWQTASTDDMRISATGVITHKSAHELYERYQHKIWLSYAAEQWFTNQIKQCEEKLQNITTENISNRRKQNKLKHWQERRLLYRIKLNTQILTSNRYERLLKKWLGICKKIRVCEIYQEIQSERHGNGHRYGFNPNMQSRETATDMFSDFEW